MSLQSADFYHGLTTITVQYDSVDEPDDYSCLRLNLQDGNLEFYNEQGKLLKSFKPLSKIELRSGPRDLIRE